MVAHINRRTALLLMHVRRSRRTKRPRVERHARVRVLRLSSVSVSTKKKVSDVIAKSKVEKVDERPLPDFSDLVEKSTECSLF